LVSLQQANFCSTLALRLDTVEREAKLTISFEERMTDDRERKEDTLEHLFYRHLGDGALSIS
jgi:hypothetical protein